MPHQNRYLADLNDPKFGTASPCVFTTGATVPEVPPQVSILPPPHQHRAGLDAGSFSNQSQAELRASFLDLCQMSIQTVSLSHVPHPDVPCISSSCLPASHISLPRAPLDLVLDAGYCVTTLHYFPFPNSPSPPIQYACCQAEPPC